MIAMTLFCRAKEDANLENQQGIQIIRLSWRHPNEDIAQGRGKMFPLADIMLCVEDKDSTYFKVGECYLVTIEGESEATEFVLKK